MKSTTCAEPSLDRPQLAICLQTVGDDYQNFLHATLAHTVLPKSLVDASEQDYTPFLNSSYSLYGDYGFGHFLECYDSVAGFTEECKKAQVYVRVLRLSLAFRWCPNMYMHRYALSRIHVRCTLLVQCWMCCFQQWLVYCCLCVSAGLSVHLSIKPAARPLAVGIVQSCGRIPTCARSHSDPGAFGYFPLIDRRLGYYMQVVAYEAGQYYPRSGIPEYLRLAAKPLVDAIIEGNHGESEKFAHHTPRTYELLLNRVDV